MISASKRKQLEAAGYTVSKSGKTVTKGEGTVAGINENGKVFGSGKAFDILKGSDSSAPSESKKPKARSTSSRSPETTKSSSAPTEPKRPKQRQMGRGEPNYGKETDKPVESTMGGPRRGRTPTPTRDRREGTTLLRSPDRKPPQGVSEKRQRAKEVLSERRANEATTKAKQDSAPTFSSYMNEKRKENPEAFREDPSGFTQQMRDMYNTTFGFNKGGMVRKGNTSYKDKGMFYKSASPRGYK